ncbi:MAG: MFS transporter [Clostridiales bacterium]|nr:MFS transporter [Clostridiales bacterium]
MKEITARERHLFAAADIWGGGGQTIISVLYLVFLTNVLGVGAGLAGTSLLVVKIWDAVIDPVIGVIEDNTRTRWGRRRPYLMFGGAALIAAIAVLWLPARFDSSLAKALFIIATNIFYSTTASVLAIAYSSMSSEITGDFRLCNKVNLTRLLYSMASTAICTLLPTSLFGMLADGRLSVGAFYSIVVFGFGSVFAIPIILAGIFCRERVPVGETKSKLEIGALVRPYRLKAFRRLIALYITQTVTMDTVSSVIIYYGLHVVPGISSTVFLGTFLAVQLLMFPVINKLINTVSKTKLFRFGLPLSIAGAIGVGIYPSGGPAIGVYLLAGITALGFAGAMTLSWIMYPDIVDIGELVTGERNSGTYSAAMAFIRQVSSAFAIFAVGNILAVTGFVSSEAGESVVQPAGAILAIRLIIIFAFVILCSNGWRVAGKLKLSPEKAKQVKVFLEKARSGISLDSNEMIERDAMLAEWK